MNIWNNKNKQTTYISSGYTSVLATMAATAPATAFPHGERVVSLDRAAISTSVFKLDSPVDETFRR
jgi:hypothetical protein